MRPGQNFTRGATGIGPQTYGGAVVACRKAQSHGNRISVAAHQRGEELGVLDQSDRGARTANGPATAALVAAILDICVGDTGHCR